MARKYLKTGAAAVATPPQSEPLNERQVANSAGGYAFPVDCWKRMDRFLILGSEGGSYYADEKKLTKENINAVADCVKDDGERAVKRIVEISDAGRAPKNDPALLALAYAAGKGDPKTVAAALDALPKVARIGTHLFHFVDYVQEFRGWGSALRNAVANWYRLQDIEKFADQVVKYQQRDGWSHADLLRLSHAKFTDRTQHAIARWILDVELAAGRELKDKEGNIVRRYPKVTAALPERIVGHTKLQATKDAKEAAALIRQYGLVRESVPTELLTEKLVWEALLEKMPMTAMIRNLGNMSKCELLVPLSQAQKDVVAKISDRDVLKKARVHPIQLLVALRQYAAGHGMRGKGQWTVVPQVVEALDDAYYAAFENIVPTGKRFYLGLDISGSMYGGVVAGIEGFDPAQASGAMAMVTISSEKNYYCAGFTTGGLQKGQHVGWGNFRSNIQMEPLKLTAKQSLDTVVKHMRDMSARMGGTDCALPMLDAMQNKMPVDQFVILTDSETWHGGIHPAQALEQYRQKMGIPAKLVVMAMEPNQFSIADPNDGGMLDVVGFDTNTPAIISDFARE